MTFLFGIFQCRMSIFIFPRAIMKWQISFCGAALLEGILLKDKKREWRRGDHHVRGPKHSLLLFYESLCALAVRSCHLRADYHREGKANPVASS